MKNISRKATATTLAAPEVGVQCTKVRCSSRQTPASNDRDSSVQPVASNALGGEMHFCGSCHTMQPIGNFYRRDRHGTPDRYCKECRKAANRCRRKGGTDGVVTYPVITRITDPEVRMQLILNAMRKVRESVRRKRLRRYEEEEEEEF